MRSRVAVGAGAFGLGICLMYVVLRLLALDGDDPGAVSLHIPFYWRTSLAAVHGVAVGVAAGLFVREPETALGWIPTLVAVVVPGCVLIALVVP